MSLWTVPVTTLDISSNDRQIDDPYKDDDKDDDTGKKNWFCCCCPPAKEAPKSTDTTATSNDEAGDTAVTETTPLVAKQAASPENTVVVLVLDGSTRKFELVAMEDAKTVEDVLLRLPDTIEAKELKRCGFVSLLDDGYNFIKASKTKTKPMTGGPLPKKKKVLFYVAMVQNVAAFAIRNQARKLLKDESVISTVRYTSRLLLHALVLLLCFLLTIQSLTLFGFSYNSSSNMILIPKHGSNPPSFVMECSRGCFP